MLTGLPGSDVVTSPTARRSLYKVEVVVAVEVSYAVETRATCDALRPNPNASRLEVAVSHVAPHLLYHARRRVVQVRQDDSRRHPASPPSSKKRRCRHGDVGCDGNMRRDRCVVELLLRQLAVQQLPVGRQRGHSVAGRTASRDTHPRRHPGQYLNCRLLNPLLPTVLKWRPVVELRKT